MRRWQNRRCGHGERGRTRPSAAELPVSLTTFVGRRRELEELTALVRAHRFVTATGPGGVGKTRLCVEVAKHVADELPDGAMFVDLASVTNDDRVLAAVADAVERAGAAGFRPTRLVARRVARASVPDRARQLRARARVVRGDAPSSCSNACPSVTILATSRTRLLSAGETVFAVPGLSVDGG